MTLCPATGQGVKMLERAFESDGPPKWKVHSPVRDFTPSPIYGFEDVAQDWVLRFEHLLKKHPELETAIAQVLETVVLRICQVEVPAEIQYVYVTGVNGPYWALSIRFHDLEYPSELSEDIDVEIRFSQEVVLNNKGWKQVRIMTTIGASSAWDSRSWSWTGPNREVIARIDQWVGETATSSLGDSNAPT